MSDLIEELKKEHATIAATLDEVNKLGIGTQEGQAMLMSAKTSFLAHLKKEDEQMYPLLNRAAESDPELKQTLEFYAKDMDEVTKAALEFFEKYSHSDAGMEFAKEYGKLFTTLSLRIRKEEAAIYKKFEELGL